MIERNVEQHAEEAAFLWLLRDRAACSPAYTRADMAHLDERVEAHLDGLRVAGEAAWEICKRSLALDDAGEVFALSELAIETQRWQELAATLDATVHEPALQRGIVSAMGWAAWERVETAVLAMIAPQGPADLKLLGLAGAMAHRRSIEGLLEHCLASEHPRLRCRALRACGELGARHLVAEITAQAQQVTAAEADQGLRFWASWALVLLGERQWTNVLWDIAFSGSAYAPRALDLAVRASAPVETSRLLQVMRMRPDMILSAIDGAAASGEPSHIGWLLECLGSPEQCRRAALALCTIAGIDLQGEQAVAKPPPGAPEGPTDDPDDDDVAVDADGDLLWPDCDALGLICHARQSAIGPGQRHLLGKPIAGAWLEELLASASQHHRRAAAFELVLMRPGSVLPETRSPAFRR